jgi:hypothetical protein
MDAQLTVLIVSVDHEYLFIIYVVSAGIWCASFFVVCRDPRLSDSEHCACLLSHHCSTILGVMLRRSRWWSVWKIPSSLMRWDV